MLYDSIAAISAQLVDAPAGQTGRALASGLEILRTALGADSVALHLCDGDDAWLPRATAPRPLLAPALPVERLPWLRQALEKRETLALSLGSAGSALPVAASAERDFAAKAEIREWLLAPLVEAGRLAGVLELRISTDAAGSDAARTGESRWPSGAEALVRIGADLTLAALRRERDTERLGEHMRTEALGRAAGGVAHDFNNFLTAIVGYCDLLEEDLALAGDAARGDVEEIRAAAERAGGLVDQILRCARPGASVATDTAHAMRVAPSSAIRSLARLLERIAGDQVRVGLELDPSAPELALEPAAFDQLLMNLVSNARNAMPSGGALQIETARRRLDASAAARLDLRPGTYALLSVRDDGRGMSERTRRHLFVPFFTTRPRSGGTGLGLATVAAIVERAGGAIEVESRLGGGTAFRLWLPGSTQAPRRACALAHEAAA